MITNLDTIELEAVIGGQTRCWGESITLGDFVICLGITYTT